MDGLAPMMRARPSLTTQTLIALVLGFGSGLLAHAAGWGWEGFAAVLDPIGTMWMNALRMTVVPLVLANLLVGIAGGRDTPALGKLGGYAFAMFVGSLAVAGLVTITIAPWILEALPSGVTHFGPTARAMPPAPDASASFSSWLTGLVPANVVRAAADGDILPLLLFTLLFALALNRVSADLRRPIVLAGRAISEVMGVVLRWVLALMPIGVFALSFPMAARTGPASAGAVGTFVALESLVLIAATVLLYPVVALAGRVTIRKFARAVSSAQAVALSTRSSIAALPSLMEGASRELRLPPAVTGFVLPLSVASFKLNRTISGGLKLLFLAHAYGIAISPIQLLTFLASMILLSFSTPGIPSVGTVRSLPLYLALGIPLEGVLVLNAVDAIPDLFKTTLNVTGDLAVAVVATRFAGEAPASVPVAEAAPSVAAEVSG
jgi:Na+/H+-dicarboxylate symporter